MAFSPELSMKIIEWRRLAAVGQLTSEQMKEAIEVLRQDRVGAHIASTTSRTKKAAATVPVDTDSLLAGLMGPAE